MNGKGVRKNVFGILSIIIALIYMLISNNDIVNVIFCFLIVLAFVFSIVSLCRDQVKIFGVVGFVLSIVDFAILIMCCFFGPATYNTAVVENKNYSYNDFKKMNSEEMTSYLLKDITITASISKIDVSLSEDVGINRIYFKEGWILDIPKNCYNIDKLNINDRVRVKSKINSYIMGKVYLSNYEKDGEDNIISCDTVISILAN